MDTKKYTKNKRLKILYVAMKYDYGDTTRGYSFEHENFYKTLIRMGHEILYFDFYSLMEKYGQKKMNNMLWKEVVDKKPDLLFCVLFKDELDKKIIRKISFKTKTVTFNWFCDDHWRFNNFSKYWAPCFNYVSTTSKDSLPKYEKIGYKNVMLKQWAANHYVYQKMSTMPKKYDITFIGQPHGLRREWIKRLKASNIDIKCWGYGWNMDTGSASLQSFFRKAFWFIPRRLPIFRRLYRKINQEKLKRSASSTRLSQKDMIKVINQTKINLNLANSSDESTQQIKGRNFEIPGCGGFIITNKVDYLDDYFEIGKEVVCFDDFQDLKEKIKYYIKHDEERERIALTGYKRALKEHTYQKRFNEIFQKIGLIR